MTDALVDDILAAVDPGARPALAELRAAVGPGGMWGRGLVESRAFFHEVQTSDLQDVPGVEREEHTVRSYDGASIRVWVYRPAGRRDTPRPAVLSIHGGGFVMGSVETDQASAMSLVQDLGAVVVSVDYRCAPEHPHPAPVEDCYAALAWLARDADELGIDRDRVAVFGVSAGGGLTAGVALLARDRGGPAIALQVLGYPMLDDRQSAASIRDLPSYGVFDRAHNADGWACLLGDRVGGDDVDHSAAPARATDLTGAAAAYVEVGALDVLRDETIAYAQQLMDAGVPVDLHVFAGAYHSCELAAPDSPIARRILALRTDALTRALHPGD